MDLVETVQGRLRDRRLAGDGRAGSWVRGQAWRREVGFVRQRWAFLITGAAIAAAAITALAFLMPAGFVRGLFVGAMGTSFLAFAVVLVMLVTGTASTRMGAMAEQWTASELRPLRRRGWYLINHYLLGAEIDHLLIGPTGAIVVETKWRRSAWDVSKPDARLGEAIARVQASARSVGLWQRGLPVRSVLFLWQGELDERTETSEAGYDVIDGVTVVRGRKSAARWLERVLAEDATLSDERVEDIVVSARKHLAARDAREAREHPPLPSLERMYWTVTGCVLAAMIGVLIMLEPLSHGAPWLAAAVGGLSLVIGLFARRWQRVRVVADAWIAAVGAVGLLALFVYMIL